MVRDRDAEQIAISYAEYMQVRDKCFEHYNPNKYISDSVPDSLLNDLFSKIENCERLITQKRFPILYENLKLTREKAQLVLRE